MNSEFLPFSSLFIIFLFQFMLWRILKALKTRNANLPPGPPKLPIIGNMHQFFGVDLLHHKLTDMAKQYGPVLHIKFGEIPMVVVSSAEAVKDVTRTHDLVFAHRPTILVSEIVFYKRSDIIFSSVGDNWRQLRRISMAEFLSLKQVESFRSVREEEVLNLINSVSSSAGSPLNLSKLFFSVSRAVIARATLGKKTKEQDAFISILEEVLDMMGGTCVSDLFPSIKFLPSVNGYRSRLNKFHQQIDKVLGNIISEHRLRRAATNYDANDQGGAGNLVNALLNLQEKGTLEFPLTDDHIKALILDMFLGGIETSATVMEWAMSEMIKNPEVMHKAQAEAREVLNGKGNVDETSINGLKYLKLVTKETLRLHPPGPLIAPRESREQGKINGYDIPTKTRVLINAYALGRDPNYWTEPEKFNPERFVDSKIDYKGGNYEFVPFGSGRRICPGISFGMSNVELALAWLLYYFDWQLCNGMKKEDLDMMEKFGSVVTRKNDLFLIPIPRLYKLPAN